jgi:hypothetical protein
MMDATTTPWRRRLAGLLLPAALALAGPAVADLRHDPFAGLVPLPASELAELRGGFFTVNGFEIAFAVEVQVRMGDQLTLSSWLNPLGQGGFQLGLPGAGLVRDGDGQVQATGSLATDGTTWQFDGLAATIQETLDGFVLTTTGDYPVELRQDGKGIEQSVGDAATTLAQTRALLNQVTSILSNTQTGFDSSLTAQVHIDVLNHGQLFGPGGPLNGQNLRLGDLVGRNLAAQLGR